MSIAVVILNWNGKKLLETFLPSVVKYSEEAQIYLADNASTDQSVKYVKNHFPKVKIIKNPSNARFARGYNQALQNLTEEIYCLINNDLKVTRNWLTPLVQFFRHQHNSVSILQPKILDFSNESKFEYAGAAGGFLDKFGYPYCKGRIFNTIEKDLGQFNNSTPVFWASGACFIIKSDVFKNLNGFDESFFAHMEEIDLCWRAQNKGYKVRYVPESVVYHLGGGTLRKSHPRKTYLNFRNSLMALVKNAKGPVIFLVLSRIILDGVALLKFIFEFKPLHAFYVLKAHISFYSKLPNLLKFRKKNISKAKYYEKFSIVWSYYILKKKFYRQL